MRGVLAQPLCALLCCFLAALVPASAGALELRGHKDRLFAYPGILAAEEGGAFLIVDYDKMRDIHRRDSEPERRVRSNYVATGVRKYSRVAVHEANGRKIETGVAGSALFAMDVATTARAQPTRATGDDRANMRIGIALDFLAMFS